MTKVANQVTATGKTDYGVAWKEINGHRFIDFSDLETCPRKGTKNLLPIRGDKFNEFTFRAFRDPGTGVWFGIPTGWTRDGDPIFRKIKVIAARYYNLELPVDAMEYSIIRHHEAVKDSKFQRGKSFLYIEDPEEKAMNNTKRIIDAVKPIELAAQLTGQKLLDFSRTLAIPVKGNSEVIVKGMLIEKAQKDPKAFMEAYEGNKRRFYEIFHRALEYGIINDDNIKGYLYKNALPIGNTPLASVEFLNKDRQLSAAIEQECDAIYEKSLSPSIQKETPGVSETSMEKRLRELEEENARLKGDVPKAQEEVSAVEIEAETDEVPNSEVFTKPEDLVDVFRGRPVTGGKKDPEVWKMRELVEIASDYMSEKEIKKIMKKSDMVAKIREFEKGISLANPKEEDLVGDELDNDTF